MTKLTNVQKSLIIDKWTATGAIIKQSSAWVATSSEFWDFMEKVLSDAHAPPTNERLTELLKASVEAFERMTPDEQNAMLQAQRTGAGMTDTQEAADRQAWRDRELQNLTADRQQPADPRPANCRFRLQDEGKIYSRSGCNACNRTVMSGLGTRCSRVKG